MGFVFSPNNIEDSGSL